MNWRRLLCLRWCTELCCGYCGDGFDDYRLGRHSVSLDPETDWYPGVDWDRLWRKGGFNRWPSEELVRWASTLEPGSKVLEVGCGAGPNLRALASFGLDPYGVDISTEALEAARSLSGASYGVVLTPVSATELPFEDGEFDAVCDVQCFQHLTDDELPLAYEEAARVLKDPGGVFFQVFLVGGQRFFPELTFCTFDRHNLWDLFETRRMGSVKRNWHERTYRYVTVEARR